MTKRLAKCPKCGAQLELDPRGGETECPGCATRLRAPGKPRPAGGEPTLVGRALGEFEVLEAIGQGSLGVAYKAKERATGRLAVINALPSQLAARRRFVTRFYTEARAAAKLSHPNVAAVYAVGVAGGIHHVAMQHVEGEGLDAVVSRGEPLDGGRALEILKQVVAGLAAGHGRAIVHGDIKPSAICIGPDGQAWLTDLGVAKLTEADRKAMRPTPTPPLPLYTAPEVAWGGRPNSRSDLYSLGATFYHLIAGRPPFEGDSVAELIRKHANATPAALGQAAPGVDRRFTAIIDRLLRKNPTARHSSAHALLDELNALGALETSTRRTAIARTPADAPMPAAPPTPTGGLGRRKKTTSGSGVKTRQRPSRGGKRRAILIAGIACGVVAAIAGGIVLARRRGAANGGPARVARRPASAVGSETQRREAAAQTCLSRARDAAKAREWRKAVGYLDLLESDYSITAFYEANRAAAAALRREIDVERRKPPPPGPVVLRAADATIHGKARYESGAGKDNIGFWSSDDDWVSWDFEAAAGAYEVLADVAAVKQCEGNEYAVVVGGQRVIGTVRDTGSWTTFVAETIGTLTLAKGGRHTLEVRPHKRKSALMNLRSVTLRPVKKPAAGRGKKRG